MRGVVAMPNALLAKYEELVILPRQQAEEALRLSEARKKAARENDTIEGQILHLDFSYYPIIENKTFSEKLRILEALKKRERRGIKYYV